MEEAKVKFPGTEGQTARITIWKKDCDSVLGVTQNIHLAASRWNRLSSVADGMMRKVGKVCEWAQKCQVTVRSAGIRDEMSKITRTETS